MATCPPCVRAIRVDAGHAGLGSLSTQDKCDEQRVRSEASSQTFLYNNSCCPCRSVLNSPYSLGYLAFKLPSRMSSPALRGPLVMSRCIIDRSAAYLGRFLGLFTNRHAKTSESKPRILGNGPPRRHSSSARSAIVLSYNPIFFLLWAGASSQLPRTLGRSLLVQRPTTVFLHKFPGDLNHRGRNPSSDHEKGSTRMPSKTLKYPPPTRPHLTSPADSGAILVALVRRYSLVSLYLVNWCL